MRARKVFASASLLLLLTSNVYAMDVRQQQPYLQKAGWDIDTLNQQTQGAVYLRAQIKKLQKENEQLRNSLNAMRRQPRAYNDPTKDPRIQALVEENHRLSALLQTQENKPSASDARVQALFEENKKLSALLSKQKQMNHEDVSALYTQEIDRLKAENAKLHASLKYTTANDQEVAKYRESAEFYKQQAAKLEALLASRSKEEPVDHAEILNLKESVRQLESENEKLKSNLKFASLSNKETEKYKESAEFYKQQTAKLEALLESQPKTPRVDQAELLNLKEEVRALEAKNSLLMAEKATAVYNNKGEQESLAEKEGQITQLKTSLSDLKQENTKLSVALKESSQKLLRAQESVGIARNAKNESSASVLALQDTIQELKRQNKELDMKLSIANSKPVDPIERAAAKTVSVNNNEIENLKKQNESLRATIKAQTEALVSADNASQTSERLLAENTKLHRKLEMAQKANDTNGQAAKEYFAQAEKLKAEIVKRDAFIEKMQRANSNKLASISPAVGHGGGDAELRDRVATLEDLNQSLDSALQQERENVLAYRTKIREYQEKLQGDGSNTGDIELQTQMTALRLENQELKARIKLLAVDQVETPDSTVLLNQKPESKQVEFMQVQEGQTGLDDERLDVPKNNITSLNSPYPPVQAITPLLDEDGNHRYDKSNAGNQ